MKNTVLREKQHVAEREKNGKSIKFKGGRNVSRKIETFPCPVYKQVKGYKERDVVTNA